MIIPRPDISTLGPQTPSAEFAMGSVAHSDILKELRVWSKLRHPNIATFIGACISTESPSLICEYMEGGSLEDVSTVSSRIFGLGFGVWCFGENVSMHAEWKLKSLDPKSHATIPGPQLQEAKAPPPMAAQQGLGPQLGSPLMPGLGLHARLRPPPRAPGHQTG
jgi:hypothetical protein